jgi:phosphoribosylamine---glycine ligase
MSLLANGDIEEANGGGRVKVLVLGSGGREHALCWKLSQSPLLTKLWCAPGNPGTASVATNLALDPEDVTGVVEAVRTHQVDLVVIGPEAPLVAGVADALRAAGVAVFGPGAAAAELEGSKAFAKEVMEAAAVPTAGFRVFDDPAQAEAWAASQDRIVVKADGLAAGKGVVVATDTAQAVAAIRELSRTPAGGRLVLEELLEGEEISVIALCDGERFVLCPPARDHKRVGEGDSGPNTGGMGAYAPAAWFSLAQQEEIGRTVIAPTLKVLRERGREFRGALYAGMMLTPSGPRVLEFNVRFGDPETQVLMMQLGEDLLPVLDACARGALTHTALEVAEGCSVGVVIAADGYPQAPKVGDAIEGLDGVPEGAVVFHAGTRREGGRLLTGGGRVLTVCARGEDLEQARAAAYQAVAAIRIRGAHHRRDIGVGKAD